MTGTEWERLYGEEELPRVPLDDATRAVTGLPLTLRPVTGDDVTQRLLFEPALKQHPNAFRASDPEFTDPGRTEAWQAARRTALGLVPAAIAASGFADALVLRGSALMAAWFGDAAREPHDLDFVVTPDTWGVDEPRTERLLRGVALAAEELARERGGPVTFTADGAVTEGIWTYDRVPGLRTALPWSAPGLPGGYVQLDFVFNEKLPEPPVGVRLPDGTTVRGASPALSLAWKLMWLSDDMYPQAKDLYDAVLLAERYPLPYSLLDAVFRAAGGLPERWPGPLLEDLTANVTDLSDEEWDTFASEYPHLAVDRARLPERLRLAVADTYAGYFDRPR
ncbi:nucleotidyl transferase AbiEii/AbiGii toxin family protein [Streptomyces sp. NPDC090306]|uniref:nucleotidyl transferase AbiEii/AbiGii toxin family protein n=1 Tax=Streptomyces sp. NPDC090306 TaxID=3365961 RepID=UPI003800328A